MALFKKYRLVDENEIERIIEKRLRQYDPTIHSMALMKKEMTDNLTQQNLFPEEKLALYKANQNRFGQLNKGFTTVNPATSTVTSTSLKPITTIQSQMIQPADSISKTSLNLSTSNADIAPLEDQSDDDKELIINAAQEINKFDHIAHGSAIDNSVIKNLHPRYSDKSSALINFLQQFSNRIAYDSKTHEAIIDGVQIPKSSISHLISSLYVKPEKLNLKGAEEFKTTFANLLSTEFKGKISSLVSQRPTIKNLDNLMKQNGKQKGKGIPAFFKRKLLSSSLSPPPGKSIRLLKLY